tara:strand:+ start:762 stop:1010 length:249 start_codon:yes stop_codon:yes gene_type:complete
MPRSHIIMDQACVEANRQVKMIENKAIITREKEDKEARMFIAYLAKEARKDEKQAAKEERKAARKAAKKAAKKAANELSKVE